MDPIDYLDTLILSQQNFEQGKSEIPVHSKELEMLRMFIQGTTVRSK